MDEDGVYNVNDFNDRLLLGLKGTLFEALCSQNKNVQDYMKPLQIQGISIKS